MAFQICSVLFRDPIDSLVSCLSQTKHPKTIMSTMLSSFARTLPFNLHQLLVWLQKTLMTQIIQSIESFYKVFTALDQTTRKCTFQAFTSVHLAHYKWPERHFHNTIVEIDISMPGKGNLVSAILTLPVTLAPLAEFKLAGLDPFRRHENSSSPAKCSRM